MKTSLSQYWREQTSLGYAIAQKSKPDLPTRRPQEHPGCAHADSLLFNICAFYALAAWSLWPLIFGIVFFAWLVQRHALRNRDKSLRIRDRLRSGAQTYLDQIPIFIGQLNYRTRRKKK